MAEQEIALPEAKRGITIMVAGKFPPPAFLDLKNESGGLIQRYAPSSLEAAERAMNEDLIKAVKLSLFCFNAHWPSSAPMRHFQADVMERLNGVVDRAEALIGEEVEEPDPPRIVPPAQDEAPEKGDG